MKELKKIFLLLVMLFLGISVVNAKEDYTVSWKNDELSNGSVVGTIRHMLKIDDGLLVGGYDDFKVMVMKLDNDGKEVKKLVLDYEGVVNGIYEYNGKYFFIATNDDELWNFYVYEINSDLEIQRSKATGFYEEGSFEQTNLVDNKLWITSTGLNGFAGVSDDDDYYDSFYINLDDFTTEVGEAGDFSNFSKSDQALILFNFGSNLLMSSYVGHGFSMLGGNVSVYGDGYGFYDVFRTDDLEVLRRNVETGELPSEFDNWEDFYHSETTTKYSWYTRIIESDDYLIAGGENYPYLDLFDFNGEYVDHIDIVDYLYGASNKEMSSQLLDMIVNGDKLYVAYQYCDIVDDCSVNCKLGVVEIKTRYNIETKITDGKGTIKVIEVADSGEEITFEVTPEKGYVLDVIKVTDANGNVVTFTDYKFTMPSADVMIEVSFKKEPINPNTKDTILVIGVLAIISGGLMFILRRKKNSY